MSFWNWPLRYKWCLYTKIMHAQFPTHKFHWLCYSFICKMSKWDNLWLYQSDEKNVPAYFWSLCVHTVSVVNLYRVALVAFVEKSLGLLIALWYQTSAVWCTGQNTTVRAEGPLNNIFSPPSYVMEDYIRVVSLRLGDFRFRTENLGYKPGHWVRGHLRAASWELQDLLCDP